MPLNGGEADRFVFLANFYCTSHVTAQTSCEMKEFAKTVLENQNSKTAASLAYRTPPSSLSSTASVIAASAQNASRDAREGRCCDDLSPPRPNAPALVL